MVNYILIKDLISQIEKFHIENSSNNLTDFIVWLNNKLFADNHDKEPSNHDDLLIAFKVMYLNKELKKQTKAVLSKSNISSIDEYSFLLHLDSQDSYRKMEIIDLHNLEAPTGIEIIKRLLKNNLIEEFPDNEDKRAKRIRITKIGKNELKSIKPQILEIFTAFTAPLNLNEKIQIYGILDKLSGQMK